MDTHFNIDCLPPYVFNLIGQEKHKLIASGHDIIDLSMGNPDGPAPDVIIEELIKKAQLHNMHRYSVSVGIEPLRQAISDWYQEQFNVSICPNEETITTIGAKEGLAHLAWAMIQKGDEVIAPDPCYPIHHYAFLLAGASMRPVALHNPAQFLDDLKKECDQKPPKAVVVNFPSNPSTLCADEAFFKELVDLALHHQFWVVHDFAYAHLGFDGYKPSSILEIPRAKEVCVEVYSLSKTYNMAGWRVGFVSGNKQLVGALRMIKSYVDYGMFAPIQHAAATALRLPQVHIDDIVDEYRDRRDALVEGLNEIGWPVDSPKATMFLWAKIPDQFKSLDSLEFTRRLMHEAGVLVSPGVGFGKQGEDHVRFAFIEGVERTQEVIQRLGNFFEKK